jgi:cytochrome b6-f complex iron-sulfur subunit
MGDAPATVRTRMNDQPIANPTSNDRGIDRRSFLKYAGIAFGAVAVIELGGIGFAYLQPRIVDRAIGSVNNPGALAAITPGSVTQIVNGRFYLTRLDDGGFLALYQRCTHLGCTVPWNQAERLFVCPCHNSQFDDAGTVLNPPAPRPLDRFAVEIDAGMVKVDTGAAIARDAFDTSQVVYA